MKISLFALLLMIGMVSCHKHNDSQEPDVPRETDTTCGPLLQKTLITQTASLKDSAWVQVPCHYYLNQTKDSTYPLMIYLNGMYEGAKYGNLNKLLGVGLPFYMKDSIRFAFDVNGVNEKMIILSPQSPDGYLSSTEVNNMINDAISKYRVDTKRIYLTGVSAGAYSILNYITDKPEYAARIAAVVPMSTTELDSTHKAHLKYIADAKIHVRIFCGDKDVQYLPINKSYVDLINQYAPGLAVFTSYDGFHGSWNNLFSLSHRYYNPNIYEWVLQYHK